jgi:hypothetical protein
MVKLFLGRTKFKKKKRREARPLNRAGAAAGLAHERFAANGEVKADSPEEAKAKILGRYHQGDLIFCEYVDGEEPDHIGA